MAGVLALVLSAGQHPSTRQRARRTRTITTLGDAVADECMRNRIYEEFYGIDGEF